MISKYIHCNVLPFANAVLWITIQNIFVIVTLYNDGYHENIYRNITASSPTPTCTKGLQAASPQKLDSGFSARPSTNTRMNLRRVFTLGYCFDWTIT